MSPLVEGQVLEGKYVVVRRLAEGGMSTVFLAVNRRIGKDVAVKVLHPIVAHDPELVERFEREARIASSIRSDHIADVFDFGELPSGERYMVMEYLEGESLASWLERERTIAPRLLASIADQILDALSAAHAAGIVHRDLKPENIVVTLRGRDPVVKVVDFGISKVVDTSANGTLGSVVGKRTAPNAVIGTPMYMSPEQARGNTALVDHRTDLYALGVILYEALTGEPPATGENVNELLFKVALEEPTPLLTKAPATEPGFAAIVTRAMKKDPAERYASADEMREAIRDWQEMFLSGSLPPFALTRSLRAEVMTPLPIAPPRRRFARLSIGAPLLAAMIALVASPSGRQAVWRASHATAALASSQVQAAAAATVPQHAVPKHEEALSTIVELAPIAEDVPAPIVIETKAAPKPQTTHRPPPPKKPDVPTPNPEAAFETPL
jgi:serine/threonine protein kinase